MKQGSREALLATVIGGLLISSPAFAQSKDVVNSKNWMTQEKANEWRASKLKGVNIYNKGNEKIGDINELILDRDGKIDAVIVGVGGFLGVGEHDVAVPFREIKWVDQPVSNSAAVSNARPVATTVPAGTPTGAINPRTANTAVPAAGTVNGTATGTTVPVRTAVADTNRTYPDHGVLDMTKDQLKAAPQFRYGR